MYRPRIYDFDKSNDLDIYVFKTYKEFLINEKNLIFIPTYFTERTAQCLTSLRTASDTRVRL